MWMFPVLPYVICHPLSAVEAGHTQGLPGPDGVFWFMAGRGTATARACGMPFFSSPLRINPPIAEPP